MPTLKQLLAKLKTQLTQCKCFPFVRMIFRLKIYKKKAPATFVVKETRNGMKFQSLFISYRQLWGVFSRAFVTFF